MPYSEETKIEKYRLVEDGEAIECLVCRYTSHNENDIRFKYCGNCHSFHDPATGRIKKFITAQKKAMRPTRRRATL